MIHYSKPFLLFAGLVMGYAGFSQRDSTKPRQVTITSSFKPVLKDAAKINFNASPAFVDTSRPRLQYQIPNQNLSLALQPGSLRPLALSIDSGGKWDNESYIKVGYGNFNTPLVQAGLSLGDGRTAGLNAYAKHVSSQGKRAFQDFSNTSVDLNGFYKTSNNLEWNGRIGALQEKYNKYGFQPETANYPEDSLKVKFQTWRARLSFRNLVPTEYGLSYAPEIRIDAFNDGLSNSESNTYLNLPLQKTFGESFGVNLGVEANLSRYKPEEKDDISNNYITISPSLLFNKPNVSIQGGLRPSWDNGEFRVLPNVLAEFRLPQYSFSFQAGWTGYLRNSGFQYQAGINPWIWAPETVMNTRVEERYAGIKGSVGSHLAFSAKVGYNSLYNQPLFNNDTINGGKSFMVSYEPEMKVLHIGGELAYTVGEKFSWVNTFAINKFHGLEVNDRAWGLLPGELKSSVRFQILKDLFLNTDLYAFDGPWVRLKDDRKNLKGALDLSAGLEFRVLKNLKVWTQFNNIFNNEYQRWYQYPSYGLNFLGGVVFSFAQKN